MATTRDRERAAIAAGELAAYLQTVRRLMLDPKTPAELVEGMQRVVADVDAVIRGLSPRDQVIVALWRALTDAHQRLAAGDDDDPALWMLDELRVRHPELVELLDVGMVRDVIADWHNVQRVAERDEHDRKTLATTRSRAFRELLETVEIKLTEENLRAVLSRAGVTSSRVRDDRRHGVGSTGTGKSVQGSTHGVAARRPDPRPRARRPRS